MERIDSKISSAVNLPMDIEENTSSTAIKASGAGSAFGSEPNEAKPREFGKWLFQRAVKRPRVECQKITENNLSEKISSAMKKENWSKLDAVLQSAIDCEMSVNTLISIIEKMQKITIKSKRRVYKIGNNLNEVFMFSVNYDQTALVKVLLKLGFDVTYNRAGKGSGMYPLYYAARLGNIKIVELLLSNGSDVSLLSPSPLLAAIYENNFDMVKLLLSNGVNPNIGSCMWSAPLYRSIVTNHVDIVMLLLEFGKADPNGHIQNYPSPLMVAVIHGNVKCVELLLRRKADINELFNVKCVELLLRRKADINELLHGDSMLEYALRCEYVHIAGCLILAGATLNSNDLIRYNNLLSSSGYDQHEGVLSLNALVRRKINPYFHGCNSIEEIDAYASKIGLAPSLRQAFYAGLQLGNVNTEFDCTRVDASTVFYRSGSQF